MTRPQPTSVRPTTEERVTSAVLAVILRVAGPVVTGVRPHALGTPERQVSVRIGDVVIHVRSARVAARIRQHWDAGMFHAMRLPQRVSQTWLHPVPGTYPVAIGVELTDAVEITSELWPADQTTRSPAHLRVQVDRIVWQVCDRDSWRAIADAWFAAQRYLDG